MQLKRMTFAPAEDGTPWPATVTVTMTIEEAVWMAAVAGRCYGDSPHHTIYGCLVGNVINRYWDDGIDGALRDTPVTLPMIVPPAIMEKPTP
jgi:hypothetical protein